jgi:hypothetical protein
MEHRKKGCSPPHTYVWVKQCVNVEVTHITCWRNFDSFRSALGPLHYVLTKSKTVRHSMIFIDWLIDLFISPLNIDCPCKAYVLLPANHKIDSVNQVLWLQPPVSIGVNQHPDHHHWREISMNWHFLCGCRLCHLSWTIFFGRPGEASSSHCLEIHSKISEKWPPHSSNNDLGLRMGDRLAMWKAANPWLLKTQLKQNQTSNVDH